MQTPTRASLPPLSSLLKNLSREQLQEQLRLIQTAMEAAKDEQRYAFFEPNGAQEKFIQLLGHKQPPVAIFSAANGIGKTTTVVNILANLFWPGQNRFFSYPLFSRWPYPKRVRYVTDPALVEDIGPFQTEIRTWWPKGKFEAAKGGKNYLSKFKANGWILDVMTYEQALTQFEGSTLGLIIFDEPPPMSIWHACMARLRKGGMAMVVMTPLTAAAMFFDKVVPKHMDSIVYGDIEMNCRQHGVRGQLEHADIERMIGEMDPEEVEARARGRAMHLAGLIYKGFDARVHMIDPIAVPRGADVIQVVDPHIDKPWACIWGFADRTGTFFQFDEWPNEDFYSMHHNTMGLDDYKRLFLQKEQNFRVTKRIIDRHFSAVRSHINKRTLREELAAIGLLYEPSYFAGEGQDEVDVGIHKVRSHLSYDSNRAVDTMNRPTYFVTSNCINTVKGYQRWSLDPKTGKPKDDFKDFMDCVRYALMSNPRAYEPIPDPAPRKLYG